MIYPTDQTDTALMLLAGTRGLHQHLSTLGSALHTRPIFMEGQP